MSSIFDFARFRKYFNYDLAMARNKDGVSILVLMFFPLYSFFFYQLFSFLITGHMSPMSIGNSITAYIICFCITVISFPMRCYGGITRKGTGSNWVLRPASAFEKFLSMLLITCVVLPAVWLAGMVFSEWILSVVFPEYVSFGLPRIISSLEEILAEFHADDGTTLAFSVPFCLYLSWCENILNFTLGAVLFRKNKVVCTFLSLIALMVAFSVFSVPIFKSVGGMNLIPSSPDSNSIIRLMNMMVYGSYIVIFLALDLGIYFRIKTIKH